MKIFDHTKPFGFRVLSNYSHDEAEKTATHRAPKKLARRCLAANYGECSGKSGEHVISKTVLKEMPRLTFTKSNGEKVGMFENNITIPVLCRTHNSNYSYIDTEMGRFFSHLKRQADYIFEGVKIKGVNPEHFRNGQTFNGNYIERWFMKTLFYLTLFEANVIKSREDHFDFFALGNDEKLSYVFSGEDIGEPFGLYVGSPSELKENHGKVFNLNVLKAPIEVNQEPGIIDHFLVPYGLELTFFGATFVGFFNVSGFAHIDFVNIVRQFHGGQLLPGFGKRRPIMFTARGHGSGRKAQFKLNWG